MGVLGLSLASSLLTKTKRRHLFSVRLNLIRVIVTVTGIISKQYLSEKYGIVRQAIVQAYRKVVKWAG